MSKVADMEEHSHLYGLHYNNTKEPALPANHSTVLSLCKARGVDYEQAELSTRLETLKSILLDDSLSLFCKYGVMYFLRD